MAKTRIFEALEHAGQAPDFSSPPVVPVTKPAPEAGQPVQPLNEAPQNGGALEQKIVALYQGLRAQAPAGGQVFAFVNALPHAGASPFVRQLARVVAGKLQRNVALLDAHPASTAHVQVFGVWPEHAWAEVLQGKATLPEALSAVADMPLQVSSMSLNPLERPVFSPQQLRDFFTVIRRQSELVLLDVPSFESSPESLVLCTAVDGVVLVADAELTRPEAIQFLQDSIVGYGGKVLGIALTNKRAEAPAYA